MYRILGDSAHDQTVAEDYFTAMQRVEQRLQIGGEKKDEVVKVQEQTQVFQLIRRLELPELCLEERLSLAGQLREVWKVKTGILCKKEIYSEGFLEEVAQ
ncbi:MAG: hypothetical protein Q7T89_07950 [Anaerolineales bacterium]|nr:hypothetical protein [Anaerolineales bacterium]